MSFRSCFRFREINALSLRLESVFIGLPQMLPPPRSLFYKIRKSRAAAPCQAPHSTMRTFASCPRRRVNRSSHPSIPPVSPTTFLVNTPLSFPLSLLSPIRPSSFPYLFFSLSLLSSIRPAPFLISSIAAGMLPAPAFQKNPPSYPSLSSDHSPPFKRLP